jgi:ABC-type multidrug transport system permease subunit
VGNTISGATNMPFGLFDPSAVSNLAAKLNDSKRFSVIEYKDLNKAKDDLQAYKIIALAVVAQDPLEDSVEILTEGHNPLVDNQIAMGLLKALTSNTSDLSVNIKTKTLFPVDISLRNFVTPGLAAYLCYVLACMNLGFSWIYEWTEKTYRQIILAPHGLRSAIIAKTLTVTAEASIVLWLAMLITAPLSGFHMGNNLIGLAGCTIASMFTYTCIGLAAACLLKTIRIYTMTISIAGVALMFMSGVIIPVEAMPDWEQFCARLFPMYYSADAFKGVMLDFPAHYGRDLLIMVIWSILGLTLSTILLLRRKAQL